jgi:hypothetical protein
MGTVWIVGGGKFGLLAARRLAEQQPEAERLIIEKNPVVVGDLAEARHTAVCAEGARYLMEHLAGPGFPDWIIPVAPIHLAFEWIKLALAPTHDMQGILLPERILGRLPNAVTGKDGAVYTSNADFICPDDCPEPEEICTVTRRARPRLMYRYLSTLGLAGFQAVVVRSRLLLPGVGGYAPGALCEALEAVGAATGPVLLATACACHGVVNAFRVRRKGVGTDKGGTIAQRRCDGEKDGGPAGGGQ